MSEHLSDNAASPQKIGVREFRGNLTAYLRQVRQGSTILVMSHDQLSLNCVRRLLPIAPAVIQEFFEDRSG